MQKFGLWKPDKHLGYQFLRQKTVQSYSLLQAAPGDGLPPNILIKFALRFAPFKYHIFTFMA